MTDTSARRQAERIEVEKPAEELTAEDLEQFDAQEVGTTPAAPTGQHEEQAEDANTGTTRIKQRRSWYDEKEEEEEKKNKK